MDSLLPRSIDILDDDLLLLILSLYLLPLLDEDDTPTEQFYIECNGSFFMSGYAVIREKYEGFTLIQLWIHI